MSTVIKAGNATDGMSFSPDGTGALEFKTGTGAGTTALTLSSTQIATFASTIQTAGITTNIYPIVSGTVVPFTAVTSITFSNIPPWAKRITIMISGFGSNGTSDPLIQLGDAGGIEDTNYVAAASTTTASASAFSSTAGFPIAGGWSSSVIFSGVVTLVLLNDATNTWAASVSGGRTDTAGGIAGGGFKALSAPLNSFRLTTVGGVNTFDANGSINILYE
jgi:hypothetical protein